MPDVTPAFDLRSLIPGLPAAITRSYLDGLTPEQHASLLRKVETGAASLRDETIRVEATINQRTGEVERIGNEVQAETGVSTLEELQALIEASADACVEQWGAVEKLLNSQAA